MQLTLSLLLFLLLLLLLLAPLLLLLLQQHPLQVLYDAWSESLPAGAGPGG